MATSGDEVLAQALENLKVKDGEYLQSQTPRTESNLRGAMDRQVNALANRNGMERQTNEMRMVKQDFETTTNPQKKLKIAQKLAKTLVRMSVKTLAAWTILGTTSVGGLAYALYDINANGKVIAWGDTTGNGMIDSALVDTNNDAVADYMVQDIDANGQVDRIVEMDDCGAVGDVVGDGGVVEKLFEGLGEVLSWLF